MADGYLVRGFCHETSDEAKLHFVDIVKSGQAGMSAGAAGYVLDYTNDWVGTYYFAADTGGSAGTARIGALLAGNGGISTTVTFPRCAEAYHGTFMPWAEAAQGGGGGVVPPISIELAAELWALSAILLSVAYAIKKTRRVV